MAGEKFTTRETTDPRAAIQRSLNQCRSVLPHARRHPRFWHDAKGFCKRKLSKNTLVH